MKKLFLKEILISVVVGGALVISCGKSLVNDGLSDATPALKSASMNNSGISNSIPAYYDAKLFNIIFVEFAPQAEKSLIAHNPGINFIYQSDPGLPGGQPFISVIDAIPGDGMNPVWREVQITFINGVTPYQLKSDDEIFAAVTAGKIDTMFTNEVYKCPVIGKKPK